MKTENILKSFKTKLCAILIAVLSLTCMLAITSSAATKKELLGVVSSYYDLVNSYKVLPGMAVSWQGTTYIVSGSFSDENYFIYHYNEQNHVLNRCSSPIGSDDGMYWFTPVTSTGLTVNSIACSELNKKYSVIYYNSEGSISDGSIEINKYEKSDGLIRATEYDLNMDSGYYPAFIIDDNSGVIGYITETGVFLFEEPGNNDRMIMLIVVAAVVIVGGGIAFWLRKNKNKNDNSENNKNTPVNVIPEKPIEVYPKEPVVDTVNHSIEASVPVPPPANQNTGWFVQMDGGVMNGLIYHINGCIIFGRNPECTVCFPADTQGISRNHCKIFEKNGKLYVVDLNSLSGTFIKGVGQLAPNVYKEIQNGDVIYLGEKKNGIIVRYQ